MERGWASELAESGCEEGVFPLFMESTVE